MRALFRFYLSRKMRSAPFYYGTTIIFQTQVDVSIGSKDVGMLRALQLVSEVVY